MSPIYRIGPAALPTASASSLPGEAHAVGGQVLRAKPMLAPRLMQTCNQHRSAGVLPHGPTRTHTLAATVPGKAARLNVQNIAPRLIGLPGRSLFTFVQSAKAPGDLRRLCEFLESDALKQVLNGAEFFGFHGTDSHSVRSIKEHGFDTGRTGRNFGGYATAGAGMYTAYTPHLAVHYARHAAGQMDKAVRGGAESQILVIFKRPTELTTKHSVQDVHADPAKDAQADEVGEAYASGRHMITSIRQKALDHQEIEYLAVELPPFDFRHSERGSEEEAVLSQLEQFVRNLHAQKGLAEAGSPGVRPSPRLLPLW